MWLQNIVLHKSRNESRKINIANRNVLNLDNHFELCSIILHLFFCFSSQVMFLLSVFLSEFYFSRIEHMQNQSVCAIVNGKNTKCISSRNNEHTLVVSRLLNYILLSFAKNDCKITFGKRRIQPELILFYDNHDNSKCR